MAQYLKSNKHANKLRRKAANRGKNIPPFLIASITTSCNLHCKGCYARANHNCFDGADENHQVLTNEQWGSIFDQAKDLGISFIILAGGEPMLREEVLIQAGLHKKILFPVFTNGTMFSKRNLELLSERPNLLPVLSVEGEAQSTDDRRGEGIYEKLQTGMGELQKRGIVFGSSITVQKDNIKEVMGDAFLQSLIAKGCKAVVYVEYVPVNPETAGIAPKDDDRAYMTKRLAHLREQYPELVLISFPGDEKTSGGCLAQALESPLFLKLQSSGTLLAEHTGGCVLFEQEELVKQFCRE